MELPWVSVAIPTYNRDDDLCQTLESILRQDYPRFEVTVIDQSSEHTPETRAFLESVRSRITIRKLQRPSLPRARNLAVRCTRFPIVLFVDDDVRPAPHLISAHVESYIRYPWIGGVVGRVVPADPSLIEPETPLYSFDRFGSGSGGFAGTVEALAETAVGCNMSFRRDVILQAGLFDPVFRGNAHREESDLSFRVRRLGFPILFNPRAELVHLRRPHGGVRTAAKGQFDWLRTYVANETIFFLRYFDKRGFIRLVRRMGFEVLAFRGDPRRPTPRDLGTALAIVFQGVTLGCITQVISMIGSTRPRSGVAILPEEEFRT